MAAKGTRITPLELAILACIVLILSGVLLKGAPSQKETCLKKGGQWTEGLQFGELTQYCTYR